MAQQQDTTMEHDQVTDHQIPLTARNVGNTVEVTGDGGAKLARDSRSHRFIFELSDKTDPKLNVRFKPRDSMIDAADDVSSCPPPSGMNSDQLVGIARMGDTKAGFTDKNDNRKADMPVSYQLHFECDDPDMTVEPFDPIIINGGAST